MDSDHQLKHYKWDTIKSSIKNVKLNLSDFNVDQFDLVIEQMLFESAAALERLAQDPSETYQLKCEANANLTIFLRDIDVEYRIPALNYSSDIVKSSNLLPKPEDIFIDVIFLIDIFD